MGKALVDVCYILPQSACKKTRKAKATDGYMARYTNIQQGSSDRHTHTRSIDQLNRKSTHSLASEATASHRPHARSDARPSPKTSPQRQQQQQQQAPSREFQLCNWKEEGLGSGNAVAKEEMVSKFLFGELDIVLCCKSKKTVRLCSGNGEERKREGRRGGIGVIIHVRWASGLAECCCGDLGGSEGSILWFVR